LPSAFVERADGRRGQYELVGEEHQPFPGLGILEADAPRAFGIILAAVEAIQGDVLVAYDAGVAVRLRRVNSMRIHVRFGRRHKEGANLMWDMEADKIQADHRALSSPENLGRRSPGRDVLGRCLCETS